MFDAQFDDATEVENDDHLWEEQAGDHVPLDGLTVVQSNRRWFKLREEGAL
jgi:hypothetical protein